MITHFQFSGQSHSINQSNDHGNDDSRPSGAEHWRLKKDPETGWLRLAGEKNPKKIEIQKNSSTENFKIPNV